MTNYKDPSIVNAGVKPCPIHSDVAPGAEPYRFDPDCEGCKQEVATRSAVVDRMQRDAVKVGTELAREGMQLPNDIAIAIRVDAFIDLVLTDPRARAHFEGEVGRRTMVVLEDTAANMRRAKLTAPIDLSKVRDSRAANGSPFSKN